MRAGGTHRIFRHASYERIRRMVPSFTLGGAASEIVPWIQLAHTCGPDHRDFAPDLEWGGTVGSMALPPHQKPADPSLQYCPNYSGPFDTFAIASPYDTADDLVHGKGTTRLDSLAVAGLVADAAARARLAAGVNIDPANREARDLQRFHWREELKWLALDEQSLLATQQLRLQSPHPPPPGTPTVALPPAEAWLAAPRAPGPGMSGLELVPSYGPVNRWTVTVKLGRELAPGGTVSILWKNFAALSSHQWRTLGAKNVGGGRFQATVSGSSRGALFAVEVDEGPGHAWRYPDVTSATPYVAVPP